MLTPTLSLHQQNTQCRGQVGAYAAVTSTTACVHQRHHTYGDIAAQDASACQSVLAQSLTLLQSHICDIYALV